MKDRRHRSAGGSGVLRAVPQGQAGVQAGVSDKFLDNEAKTVVIVMTSGPATRGRCATPFYLGALLASMDAEVTIFFTMAEGPRSREAHDVEPPGPGIRGEDQLRRPGVDRRDTSVSNYDYDTVTTTTTYYY